MITDEEASEKKSDSCWKRCTWLEITLLIVVVVGAFFMSIYVVKSKGVAEEVEDDSAEAENNTLTQESILNSAAIHRSVDLSADPCDDFYQFACGNFMKNNLPSTDEVISSESIARDEIEKMLKSALEDPVDRDEPRPYTMVKALYSACKENSDTYSAVSNLSALLFKAGGWPVVEGPRWSQEMKWEHILYKFMTMGLSFDMLFEFSVTPDPTNQSKNVLYLNQPSLGFLSTETFRKGFESPAVNAYHSFMVGVAKLFGAKDFQHISVESEMRDVISFMRDISKTIYTPDQDIQDPYNNGDRYMDTPLTIQDLRIRYKFIDWHIYIDNMLDPTTNPRTIKDVVIVSSPSYFRSLEGLLKTKKRTLANYLFWRAIEKLIPYLGEEINELFARFKSEAYNTTISIPPMWKQCLETVGSKLNEAASALFLRKYFGTEDKDSLVEMLDNIRSQFTEILENVDWMDTVTQEKASHKDEDLDIITSYPNELLDDKVIDEYYAGLVIDPTKYLESILNVTIFLRERYYYHLDVHVNNSDWRYLAKVLGVYPSNMRITSSEDEIIVPTHLILGTHFSSSRPQYLNYATAGVYVAMELTKWFHDEGFDMPHWWGSKTKVNFEKKTQCLLREMTSDYIEVSRTIDVMGGAKAAFLAYRNWTAENEEEEGLLGLDYTPEQLFWISLAGMSCSVTSSQEPASSVDQGISSKSATVALQNLDYFSESFECADKMRMNPKHKCNVW